MVRARSRPRCWWGRPGPGRPRCRDIPRPGPYRLPGPEPVSVEHTCC